MMRGPWSIEIVREEGRFLPFFQPILISLRNRSQNIRAALRVAARMFAGLPLNLHS
jgi:hypothetical protein